LKHNRYLAVFGFFLTGVLHANFIGFLLFNTMNSSDGVSILDLNSSFDSGVGGGDAGGTSAP